MHISLDAFYIFRKINIFFFIFRHRADDVADFWSLARMVCAYFGSMIVIAAAELEQKNRKYLTESEQLIGSLESLCAVRIVI